MTYFNIELVLERIRDFFVGIVPNMVMALSTERRIAIAYLFTVLLLMFVAHMTQKNYFRILQQFVMKVDEIIYRYTYTIASSKEILPQYQTRYPELFAAKKKFTVGAGKNYVEDRDSMKLWIDTVQAVLENDVVSVDEWATLYRLKRFIQRMHALYAGLVGVLSVLTVGIYWLGHKKLHY